MKIKIDVALKGVDGVETLKTDNGRNLTLRDVCINSVLTPLEGDDEKKKLEKYDVFKKIRDAKEKEIDLTAEEIVLIKRAIGKVNSTIVVGQCFELLEDNSVKEPKLVKK